MRENIFLIRLTRRMLDRPTILPLRDYINVIRSIEAFTMFYTKYTKSSSCYDTWTNVLLT